MASHIFALRAAAGVPSKIKFRKDGVPEFSHREYPYRLIEDDDVAEFLRQKEGRHGPYFRHLSAEDLEAALASASDAVDAIAAGEYDDVLDLLLFAERREYGRRITVIEAIDDRQRALKEQLRDDGDETGGSINPADVAPRSLG